MIAFQELLYRGVTTRKPTRPAGSRLPGKDSKRIQRLWDSCRLHWLDLFAAQSLRRGTRMNIPGNLARNKVTSGHRLMRTFVWYCGRSSAERIYNKGRAPRRIFNCAASPVESAYPKGASVRPLPQSMSKGVFTMTFACLYRLRTYSQGDCYVLSSAGRVDAQSFLLHYLRRNPQKPW